MVLKTPEFNLDCFAWLPSEKWTPEHLMGPTLGGDIMCKICDKYISLRIREEHIKIHVKERDILTKKRKKIAEKKRIENMRLAREAKKLMQEGNQNKLI